ncbi:hypothetical protein AB1Y20_004628 [Prymnesium parvum]|uniref:Lipase maturation factor n=1 Tax=Prymnesium parvum TaxID=97485 RepID=A0AB34IYY0_PRYPA
MGMCRRRAAAYEAVATEEAAAADPLASPRAPTSPPPPAQTFVTATSLILRGCGAVYFFAFLAAFFQNRALIGSNGLAPAHMYFERLRLRPLDGFLAHPAIWWWVPLTDDRLDAAALAGLALSALVCVGLSCSAVMLALWLLYFSIVSAAEGSSFYAYGWESQLLETGFLAMLLCEPAPWRLRPSRPPSLPALWLLRWLMFRISIGAGLIKVRGDSCWTQRTCLWHHFETQPLPSPGSFVFHFLPRPVLSAAIDLDLFVQLYTAWLVLLPGIGPLRWLRRAGGFLQAGFMVNIALSGNFSLLNHLTVLPALACLDDACWPAWLRRAAPAGAPPRRNASRLLVDTAALIAVGYLSWPVVANLLQLDGRRQVMNSSFNSFRLVNTYGAFGSVGEARYEPILSVSSDGKVWTELDFPCKPGNVTRRPCFCAPYHYRLDWNIWFIGFKPHQSMLQQRERWLFTFVEKLLAGDELAISLLDRSSYAVFTDPNVPGKKRRPKFAKVDMWRYEMSAPLWELVTPWFRGETVTWWRRKYEEQLIPTVVIHQGQLALAAQ